MQENLISEVVNLSKSENFTSDFESYRKKVLSNLAVELSVNHVTYWHCDDNAESFICLDRVNKNGDHDRPLSSIKGNQCIQLQKRLQSGEILIFRKKSEVENIELFKPILTENAEAWLCLPLFVAHKQKV